MSKPKFKNYGEALKFKNEVEAITRSITAGMAWEGVHSSTDSAFWYSSKNEFIFNNISTIDNIMRVCIEECLEEYLYEENKD